MKNDGPKESHATRWCTITVLLTSAVLVLYVLSVGPAVWCMEHEFVTESTLTTFYSPLINFSSKIPPLYRLLDWYAVLWQ